MTSDELVMRLFDARRSLTSGRTVAHKRGTLGLASLCIGSGQGIAAVIERV